MKKVVFIGNRHQVLDALKNLPIDIIKVYALENSILSRRLISCEAEFDSFTIKDKKRIIHELSLLEYDILLSNGCPFKLPDEILSREGKISINVHPTLLPDLKGKTPINGVFWLNKAEFGASVHFMTSDFDAGPIIARRSEPVTPDLNLQLLYKISFELEAEAFLEAWQILQKSNFSASGMPQNSNGEWFDRTSEMMKINFATESTASLVRKIKSFGIENQGTFAEIDNKPIHIWQAREIFHPYLLRKSKSVSAGDIVYDLSESLLVKTVDGLLLVERFRFL